MYFNLVNLLRKANEIDDDPWLPLDNRLYIEFICACESYY